MLAHQEFDHAGVVARNAVLAAELPYAGGAELGVVAATSLGNVVEQRCHVQDPRLVPAGGQLRAERVFVGVFDDEEAAHIAQHHQDVLVHGVDVEQVVLHLPDDAPEHPQIAPQHRGLVHQPHRVGDAVVLQHDLRKVSRLTGSLRKPASIKVRALYRARSVRADRPLMPTVVWKIRKVSKMACGSRWYRSSLATSIMPALSKNRALMGRSVWVDGFSRSSMLSSTIWLSWVTALAAQ